MHVLSFPPKFSEGGEVSCEIDIERRFQLAKHHTSTHIVNAAARKILGNHINQAGAKKDLDKATIDITHYQALTDEELKKIEKEANKIVKNSINVGSSFYPRTKAEQEFGMGIYQGGAVPGKQLRIVNIKDIDVEACGGTHLKNTSEAGEIKILKAAKISDGIVRIYFTAGEASQKEKKGESQILEEASKLFGVKTEELPARVNELFEKWKLAKKLAAKGKKINPADLMLSSKEIFNGDVLAELCKILRTQPEHINKTIQRFLREIGKMCKIK